MGCFESLVKSHFLANVSKELSEARLALQGLSLIQLPTTLPVDKKVRRRIYDEYVYQCYLIEEILESLKELEDPDIVYYIQLDGIIFIYTVDHSQFKDVLKYSYSMNGNIPFYKTKHRVLNKTVYTALYDTRINFTPFSIN